MNLRLMTKHHAADLEIGFLTKSILKPYGRAAAMPTARELKTEISSFIKIFIIVYFNLKYCVVQNVQNLDSRNNTGRSCYHWTQPKFST